MIKYYMKFKYLFIISLTIMLVYQLFKHTNYSHYIDGYNNKKVRLNKLNNNHRYNIVMIGDSLTSGVNWNSISSRLDILNMGQSGDQVYLKIGNKNYGTINRLEGLDSIYKKSFLMLGINDFSVGKNVNEVFNVYKKIINIILKKNIKPYIQSTLFVRDGKFNSKISIINLKVKKLNILLKEYCYLNNITFIDLNSKFQNNGMLNKKYTYDGIHLNKDGYNLWYNIIKPYLEIKN